MNSPSSPIVPQSPDSEDTYATLVSSQETKELIKRLYKKSRSNDYPTLHPGRIPGLFPTFTNRDFL